MKNVLLLILFAVASNSASAQSDSIGVWAIKDGTASRIEMIKMQKVKGTGALGHAFTLGMSQVKAKLVFDGAYSENRFQDEAKLRIYFGQPPIEQIQRLYMFATGNSIKDFGIGEFETKKQSRQLVTIKANIFGSQSGADKADEITVETKEIGNGVYELTIKGKPGEYCLMHTANGAGGYGGVFDFAIEE